MHQLKRKEFFDCLLSFSLLIDGGMKHLQICMFDSDFYLHQVRILHLDVKFENVQLCKLMMFEKQLLLFKTSFTFF